jgi:hypothetical protein
VYDALKAYDALKTYDAVKAKDAVTAREALIANDELTAFKTYDAVKAYDALKAGFDDVNIEPLTYDAVVAVPNKEPVIPVDTFKLPVIVIPLPDISKLPVITAAPLKGNVPPPPVALRVPAERERPVPIVISSIIPTPEVLLPTSLFVFIEVLIVPVVVIVPPDISPAVAIEVTVPLPGDPDPVFTVIANVDPLPLVKVIVFKLTDAVSNRLPVLVDELPLNENSLTPFLEP